MESPQLYLVCSGSIRETPPDPLANAFLQDRRQILNRDTLLPHRIAVPQRDCIAQRRIFFAERFEINCHTERRTDFVLPAVSPTDRATLVIEDRHVWSQVRDYLFRFRNEGLVIFEQWKDRALDRRDPWMK